SARHVTALEKPGQEVGTGAGGVAAGAGSAPAAGSWPPSGLGCQRSDRRCPATAPAPRSGGRRELGVMELGVAPSRVEELTVGPRLDDPARLDHQDPVGG